jgi:hypothetical protein
MNKRKIAIVTESIFSRVPEVVVGTRTIVRGDIIKINGEHGGRFRFHSLVTNTETGSQWVDCFELHKNVASGWRSFRPDRIKLIPIKRGRRNVNRG